MASGNTKATKAMGAGFDSAALIAKAEEATGLQDWGKDTSWRPGLDAFLASIDEIGAPVPLRETARERAIGILATRLHLEDERRRFPEITQKGIDRPLVVMGLARTGTTVLFDLLERDDFRFGHILRF